MTVAVVEEPDDGEDEGDGVDHGPRVRRFVVQPELSEEVARHEAEDDEGDREMLHRAPPVSSGVPSTAVSALKKVGIVLAVVVAMVLVEIFWNVQGRILNPESECSRLARQVNELNVEYDNGEVSLREAQRRGLPLLQAGIDAGCDIDFSEVDG